MQHILSRAGFEKWMKQRKNMERHPADSHTSTFERYSATERFEDILNTLKGIYFKLEIAEEKKNGKASSRLNTLRKKRQLLADIQQQNIKAFSIVDMEVVLRDELLPELKTLQQKYPNL